MSLQIYARVISSVYPLEGAIHKFMRTCECEPNRDQEKILVGMHGLFDERTNKRQIVRYIPVVLRTLLQHLASDNPILCRESFVTLLQLLSTYVLSLNSLTQ